MLSTDDDLEQTHASAQGTFTAIWYIFFRQSPNQMAFTSMVVDVTPFGADEPESLWLNVTAFGKLADVLAKHVKGDMLSLFGKVSKSRWTGKDGTEHEQLQVVADSIVSARTIWKPSARH